MIGSCSVAIDRDAHVATVTLRRPPHNFLDLASMRELADAFALLDVDADCRAIVLASEGNSFSAGADFSAVSSGTVPTDPAEFYAEALRLFDNRKPIVAAIQGAAIGAGLGLALVADFRVICPEARLAASFTRLGFHPGFGLSHTLPRLIGTTKASLLFYTGRKVHGREAVAMGLADELVPGEEVLSSAQSLAFEIASSAPIAVQSTRATQRRGLAENVRAINRHELTEQRLHMQTSDFVEGIKAMADRRKPSFCGR